MTHHTDPETLTGEQTLRLALLDRRLQVARQQLSDAATPFETELRAVWVAQIEKEIRDERAFLGLAPMDVDVSHLDEISDAELLASLGA